MTAAALRTVLALLDGRALVAKLVEAEEQTAASDPEHNRQNQEGLTRS